MAQSTVTYFVYHRINLPVSATDDEVRAALDVYADAHIKGGRSTLVNSEAGRSLAEGVLADHNDARQLYLDMRF